MKYNKNKCRSIKRLCSCLKNVWGWKHIGNFTMGPVKIIVGKEGVQQISIVGVVRIKINPLTQFSVPQIEFPLGGSSKKGSHVYFLLIVAMVLLL